MLACEKEKKKKKGQSSGKFKHRIPGEGSGADFHGILVIFVST